MINVKKHIIFDFDDTISSTYEHNQQLFVDTFLPHKPDIDQEYIRMVHYTNRGKAMGLQFEQIIQKFNLKVTVEQLVDENEVLHQKRANEVKVFDEFEDILKHFKKLGKIISLCTNRAEASLKIILEMNHLSQYFDNIVSCKDARHEKPDPYCLLQLLRKYPSITKNEVIYFGDSKTDADFASSAGIDYLVIDHYLNKKQFYTLTLGSFAGMEDELLVETDSLDRDTGVIYKTDAHADQTRYHRAAHMMLFNSKGQVILQKRSLFKAYDPGLWDMPGGHQAFGQTIQQTAKTEMREEMGIEPKLTFKKKWLKQDGKQSEWCYLYYGVHDGPYTYNTYEVAEVREFDCDMLINHKYDKKYHILEHVYGYTGELKKVWKPLLRKV